LTQIPSLPVIDVWLAFDPTADGTTLVTSTLQDLPDSGESNDYWTNCKPHIKGYDTTQGVQHFLDRVNAGTLNLTANNRTGFFFNGGDAPGNGSGYVIQQRMPIAVTVTWDDVTYPVFKGITDSVKPVITDEVNTDLEIDASDVMKELSLCYMARKAFWPTYANPSTSSTEAWYRLNTPLTFTVTSASGDGTTVTFKCLNTFASGDNVTIGGLGVYTGHGLNLTNVVVASASSTEFTVTSAFVGVSTGTGLAYRTIVVDELGGTSGNYLGEVAWPTYGAMIYDPDTCADLTNGTSSATGYIRLPSFSDMGGFDLWVLGLSINESVITIVTSSDDTLVTFGITAAGLPYAIVGETAYNSDVIVNDGYWHHIGLVPNSSGVLKLYADGTFTDMGDVTGWSAPTNWLIGNLGSDLIAFSPLIGYVDEIVVINQSSYATAEDEVKSRYRAGTMLQLGYPVTPDVVQSGDRIAEILCLAGFGSIVAGAVTLPDDFYYINDSDTAWVNNADGNGFVGTEPWYWDTPVTTSTALDLIGQITDTDIGWFFAKPDGTVAFYNQLFFGTWDWDASTNTGTWTPNTYTPTNSETYTDNDDGDTETYNYEGDSLEVLRDDADVWMMVQVTPQAGIEQIYENIDGEARWGYSTLTKTATVHTSNNLALSTANFLGYLFRDGLPRVSEVVLKSETRNGGLLPGMLGNPMGTVVNFIFTSPGASTSGTYPTEQGQINTNMVIESVNHHFDSEAGEYGVAFALDPYPIRS
jgi:hypothetical protein